MTPLSLSIFAFNRFELMNRNNSLSKHSGVTPNAAAIDDEVTLEARTATTMPMVAHTHSDAHKLTETNGTAAQPVPEIRVQELRVRLDSDVPNVHHRVLG